MTLLRGFMVPPRQPLGGLADAMTRPAVFDMDVVSGRVEKMDPARVGRRGGHTEAGRDVVIPLARPFPPEPRACGRVDVRVEPPGDEPCGRGSGK